MAATERKRRMNFGMMNHPAALLENEIHSAQALGFDFLDLTLEPPETGTEKFGVTKARAALEKTGLFVVGHTGWHLPGNAAYPEVRRGVTESLVWAARHFGSLGAGTMTYHIHGAFAKYSGLAAAIRAQTEVLKPVIEIAGELGITVVLEHINAFPEQFEILDGLFEKLDALGFHLDVGHANLSPNRENQTEKFLKKYGSRLKHVHVSDNRGKNDDHLPLGVGTVDWTRIAALLKEFGYIGTMTLEVFSADTEYVSVSLKKAKSWFG